MPERDLIYEAENKIPAEYEPGVMEIKCKNWDVCGTGLPEWWWQCKGHYICTGCDTIWGKWIGGKGVLEFKEDVYCTVCFETKRGVSEPRCSHFTSCVDCFKRRMYGKELVMIPWPYDESIREEYNQDPSDPKWNTEYPLIDAWEKYTDVQLLESQLYYEREKSIRECPLCRK
jgi:hypothetical protein